MLNKINWLPEYTPGTTDNFASNEIIVQGITVQDIFENLIDIPIWKTYHKNMGQIVFYNHEVPILLQTLDSDFRHLDFQLRLKSLNLNRHRMENLEDYLGMDGRKAIQIIESMQFMCVWLKLFRKFAFESLCRNLKKVNQRKICSTLSRM